jgi:hypothetical protein
MTESVTRRLSLISRLSCVVRIFSKFWHAKKKERSIDFQVVDEALGNSTSRWSLARTGYVTFSVILPTGFLVLLNSEYWLESGRLWILDISSSSDRTSLRPFVTMLLLHRFSFFLSSFAS